MLARIRGDTDLLNDHARHGQIKTNRNCWRPEMDGLVVVVVVVAQFIQSRGFWTWGSAMSQWLSDSMMTERFNRQIPSSWWSNRQITLAAWRHYWHAYSFEGQPSEEWSREAVGWLDWTTIRILFPPSRICNLPRVCLQVCEPIMICCNLPGSPVDTSCILLNTWTSDYW